MLLPAVEDGIFSDNWRIRQSSIELLGDLLFKVFILFIFLCLGLERVHKLVSLQVAGTSGKATLEGGSDDEGASTEAHGRAIIDVLGNKKRNEVLAAIYMVRSDVSLTVRQVRYIAFTLACLHAQLTIVILLQIRVLFNIRSLYHGFLTKICDIFISLGCIARVEDNCGKYPQDSQGNNANFDGYTYFLSRFIFL